jgi:hypothetical protein
MSVFFYYSRSLRLRGQADDVLLIIRQIVNVCKKRLDKEIQAGNMSSKREPAPERRGG